MHTEGFHRAMAFSTIVFMLFGGYFAYAALLSGQPAPPSFIQPIVAGAAD